MSESDLLVWSHDWQWRKIFPS